MKPFLAFAQSFFRLFAIVDVERNPNPACRLTRVRLALRESMAKEPAVSAIFAEEPPFEFIRRAGLVSVFPGGSSSISIIGVQRGQPAIAVQILGAEPGEGLAICVRVDIPALRIRD